MFESRLYRGAPAQKILFIIKRCVPRAAACRLPGAAADPDGRDNDERSESRVSCLLVCCPCCCRELVCAVSIGVSNRTRYAETEIESHGISFVIETHSQNQSECATRDATADTPPPPVPPLGSAGPAWASGRSAVRRRWTAAPVASFIYYSRNSYRSYMLIVIL
jgi:hypothetical protein